MLRIAVIDDEIYWQDQAVWELEQFFDGREIKISRFNSGEEFMQAKQEFDGIIMDVEMPGRDGITLMAEYFEQYPACCVILLSSHGELMNEGYRRNADRYVEKSRMREDFPEALEYLHYMKLTGCEVELKCIGEGTCYLWDEDIRYLESLGQTTKIVTQTREYRTAHPIKDLIPKLDHEKFFQCHRAFCVHWKYVKEIKAADAVLDNGTKIPIALRRSTEAKRQFFFYKFRHAKG